MSDMQRDVSHVSVEGWQSLIGHLRVQFWLLWNHPMLCCLISGSKWWNQSWCRTEVISLSSTLSKQPLWHMFTFTCKQVGNPMGTNLISHSHCHLLYDMVSYAKWHCNFPNSHPSVPFDEWVNFLLTLFGCGISRSTTAWLIGNVHVSIFKAFHLISDIAGTCAGNSIHMTKSSTDVCRWGVLHKVFCHCILAKWYVNDSHCVTWEH
jgi:hypothetical protein